MPRMHKLGKPQLFGGGMRKVEFVRRYADGKEVLDIGAVQHSASASNSKNWLHKNLAASTKRLVGLDFLEKDVELLRKQGYDIRCADAQQFDLAEQFDVVVAGDVIEHLHDLKGFLESVRRHLKADGCLILTTPNPWFWRRGVQLLLGKVPTENAEHTAWYSPGTLKELLKRHQFRIDHLEFGSSEEWLYRLTFLPMPMRHTSLFVAAGPIQSRSESPPT